MTLKATISLFDRLQATVDVVLKMRIAPERLAVLEMLVAYIQEKRNAGAELNLNFICTHNSRRSQMAEVWAQTAASYCGVQANCFSGGMEVTAFNERAVASMERSGFEVTASGQIHNPEHVVVAGPGYTPIRCFSKVFDDPANAATPFAAVMTCSHADENCPYIPGAEKRIPVRYEDPKAFDDTPDEATAYDERSMQIAAEMFYVFSKVT